MSIDSWLLHPLYYPSMEAKVSEILENILGFLALEGSFEVVEGPEEVKVSIEASDPGRLIGFKGETLDALQFLVNLAANKDSNKDNKENFKRVVIDVAGWRENKEADLERRARSWAEEVKESGEEVELDPMPSWQRRIVHMVVSETEGVESESLGEGRERHLVIRPSSAKSPEGKPTEGVKKVRKTKKETKEETKDEILEVASE